MPVNDKRYQTIAMEEILIIRLAFLVTSIVGGLTWKDGSCRASSAASGTAEQDPVDAEAADRP